MKKMLDNIISGIENKSLKVHGIEIYRDGESLSHFFDEDKRYPVYSATKTFVSAAVGLAKKEGKLSEEDKLYRFLSEEDIDLVPKSQRENFKRLSLERFLTMSVEGYPFRPQGDYMQFSLSCPVDYGKKPAFAYSNISAYLVGAAVENAVGEHLISYLKPRLLEPIGIIDPIYTNCPRGHFYGASGMELTVHELGLLGRLYLQKGKWDGCEILSEDWVKSSSSLQINNKDGGYGYFIWISSDSFRISGKWGQKCLVYPEKGLTVTYLSDLPERADEALSLIETEIKK